MTKKKLTAQEQAHELAETTNLSDKQLLERQQFALVLGFDPEHGGRRYRELVVQKTGTPLVVVNLNDALLTVRQTKIIQAVLHGKLPVQLLGHD